MRRSGSENKMLNNPQDGTGIGEALPVVPEVPPVPSKPQFCFPPPERPPAPEPAPLLNELSDLSQSAKDRELYDAAWDGDFSRAERLLQVGAYPGAQFGIRKMTALMACARAGNEEVLEKLLLVGKDHVNVQSKLGDTALHKAFEEQRIAAASVLLKFGADPHLLNDDACSAMGVARIRCPEHYGELVARYGECRDKVELVKSDPAPVDPEGEWSTG
jgi:hypothetical protein